MRRHEAAHGRQGYPKERRIRRKADFQRCRLEGQRLQSAHFLLYVHEREDADLPRSGFAVSRKVGNAVLRNRIKRILREFFRIRGLNLPCYDYMVSAKRNAGEAELDFAQISAELDPMIRRVAKAGIRHQSRAKS